MPRIPEIRNTHVYVRASGMWPSSSPPCAECGHPKANRVHDVPETHPDAEEISARILGETTEERTESA